MLWINEVEMVEFFDELKSSRSVFGKDFPKFEMLDAKVASLLNKISKRRSASRSRNPKRGPVYARETKPLFMIYDYFRVTGAHDAALDYPDLFSVTLHDDNIQEFDTRWDEVLLLMPKIPSDEIWESLYKLRIREFD